MEERQTFTLLQVTRSIRKTIAKRYRRSYWIKAELNKLNHYSHSGHCYPDLVQKEKGKVVAQIRALLWKSDYRRINQIFLKALNEPLKDGIKILFLAKINFDPKYGLSLQILDIDPNFTLGDLAQEKQETIDRLKAEGIFTKNKTRKLPLLPRRIAVISVETSKGYADFLNVFEAARKEYGFQFFTMLFPSLLQSDKAVKTLLRALSRIKKVLHHFDAVVIVRGGGGDIGLSCYNHYDLVKEIANFPIPVITGIGHSTNQTIAEMVAYQNTITPTKLAAFFVDRYKCFSEAVGEMNRQIVDFSQELLAGEHRELQHCARIFKTLVNHHLIRNREFIRHRTETLSRGVKQYCTEERQTLYHFKRVLEEVPAERITEDRESVEAQWKILSYRTLAQLTPVALKLGFWEQRLLSVGEGKLEFYQKELNRLERTLYFLNPERVLERGYSIVRKAGKVITDVDQIKISDLLEIELKQGIIESEVKKKRDKNG